MKVSKSIGVGASKFLEVGRIFVRKSCSVIFAYKFYPTEIMKTYFWCVLQKGLDLFFCKRWVPFFLSQTTLGAIFAQIFRDFAQIFRDFAWIFDKSKLLGVQVHPRLLHHCLKGMPIHQKSDRNCKNQRKRFECS